MDYEKFEKPWVSFCMSTYNRPVFLKQQLETILKQSFQNFEIVICDNDPGSSAENVVKTNGDPRLRYFPNGTNLGMIKSFNRSIEMSTGEFIVMITDDDPVIPEMLENFRHLIEKHPGYGIYIGCSRVNKKQYAVEVFDGQNFPFQILHPKLTSNLLWSSCVFKKDVLTGIGGLPDYGSPHLADHAMMALCGNINGGVMINKMFSQLIAHDNNFSKGNINLYYNACTQFFNLINSSLKKECYIKNGDNALVKHLDRWFITATFSLRKYFTYQNKNREIITQINLESAKVLQLPFMQHTRIKYFLKLIIFNLKRPLYLFKILH